MAESYERLEGLPTNKVNEVSEGKLRALEIYKSFVETTPPTDPALDKARAPIELLPQEIKELTEHVAKQELSLKVLNESLKALNDKMDQVLAALRALPDQLLRRERGGTSAGFMR
jgi:uncharacterized coiled-coil protein SlyX